MTLSAQFVGRNTPAIYSAFSVWIRPNNCMGQSTMQTQSGIRTRLKLQRVSGVCLKTGHPLLNIGDVQDSRGASFSKTYTKLGNL